MPPATAPTDQYALQHYDMQNRLANAEAQFNALADVAAENMAKLLRPGVMPIVSIAVGEGAAYAIAKLDKPNRPVGTIGALVGTAAAWTVGYFQEGKPDVQNLCYSIAGGLGTAASAINTFQYLKNQAAQAALAAQAGVTTATPTAAAT